MFDITSGLNNIMGHSSHGQLLSAEKWEVIRNETQKKFKIYFAKMSHSRLLRLRSVMLKDHEKINKVLFTEKLLTSILSDPLLYKSSSIIHLMYSLIKR